MRTLALDEFKEKLLTSPLNVMVYLNKNRMIENDIKVLNCIEYQFEPTWKGYIKEFFYFLTHRFDNYFIWFCDSRALIPVLFSLFYGKSFIFAGGFDTCPINYKNNKIRELIVKLSYRLADIVIFPSKTLENDVEKFTKLKHTEIIYHGVDVDFWNPVPITRDIDYTTIINVIDERTPYIKGLDKFIEMAYSMPGKRFLIIGNVPDINYPKNVILTGFLDKNRVKNYLNRTQYYVQLSRKESFCVALIEAMSMGCIPIVSDVGIMKFISEDVKNSDHARRRVKELFSIENRNTQLRLLNTNY